MDTAQQIIIDLAQLGMSDSDIAKEVVSSQPTIWRIRTGETKSCASDLYIALANLRSSVKKAA